MGSVAGVDPLPLLALPISVRASASSSESSDTEVRVSAMPPPLRRMSWHRWWSLYVCPLSVWP